MTFLLPNPLPPGAEALLRQACFVGGYDQTPFPTTVAIEPGRMTLTRDTTESGYLLVPWPVGPFGVFVITTSTLRERPEPYGLLLELARGKLNQVRTQTADWHWIGLRTPPDYDRELADVTRVFASAATDPASPAADPVAARILERGYALADAVTRVYVDQVFASRQQGDGALDTRLAARFTRPPAGPAAVEYRRAFTAAQVGFRWREVEPAESQYNWAGPDQAVAAARAAGLPITAGPVIDISPGMLPAWAAGWEGDLPTLAAFMCDYLETVIGRYRGAVRRWVLCAGFNHADGLGLSDDDRLRLAARLFEAALQLDPDLDLVLGVAHPWGDYLVSDDQTISPLAFADDLTRIGLRVSAVELEFRTGTSPRGSLPRDLLDTSRVLDLMFDRLQLPLEVVLGCPAGRTPDPFAAEHREGLRPEAWWAGPAPEAQAEWGASFAALALCKRYVRAVTWDHWSDADPHLMPNGGLLDAGGRSRPLLGRLQALRTAHLR